MVTPGGRARGERAEPPRWRRSTTSGVLAPGQPRDADDDGLAARTADAHEAILGALDDLGDRPTAARSPPVGVGRHGHLADVGERPRLRVAEHGDELSVAIDAPDGAEPHRRAKAVGDVVRREVERARVARVEDDLDLAHVAAEHLDAPDARHVGERRVARRTRRSRGARADRRRRRR